MHLLTDMNPPLVCHVIIDHSKFVLVVITLTFIRFTWLSISHSLSPPKHLETEA